MGIKDYLGFGTDDRKFLKFMESSVFAVILGSVGLQFYIVKIHARESRPVRFEDRNGDGIEDKVVDEIYRHPGMWWGVDSTKEEILYGTGTELNGKKLYLPKEVFEEYTSRNSEQR